MDTQSQLTVDIIAKVALGKISITNLSSSISLAEPLNVISGDIALNNCWDGKSPYMLLSIVCADQFGSNSPSVPCFFNFPFTFAINLKTSRLNG
ncbi:hypothetical protein BCT01_02530 [Vibrio tasmaniensis]|nr:hypothetical protein BCT01_02530 [Vibrio tasmaniensis]